MKDRPRPGISRVKPPAARSGGLDRRSNARRWPERSDPRLETRLRTAEGAHTHTHSDNERALTPAVTHVSHSPGSGTRSSRPERRGRESRR